MTTEAIEPQVEEVTQDDAGFESGFAEARGEEPPVEAAPEVKEQAGTAEETQAEQTATPEETPAQTLIAGLTEDELKRLLLKANSVDDVNARLEKAFGKFGEINRTLQELQKRGGGSMSAGQLKRLSGEYPELAELLASDLNEAFANSGGTSAAPFDPSELDQRVAQKVTDAERNFEKRLLRREHKDWEQVVTSDDFRLWMDNVLPAEDKMHLNATWDSEFISEKLTEFKAWKSNADGQAKPQREQKQKRLEAAVTPTSSRSPGPNIQSDDDAFAAGFSQVRSNRLY